MEHNAILICPKKARNDRKWLFKTEYFGAFPRFELTMLNDGYYVAHIQSNTRFASPDDIERQVAFFKFLHTEFEFSKTCFRIRGRKARGR